MRGGNGYLAKLTIFDRQYPSTYLSSTFNRALAIFAKQGASASPRLPFVFNR